MMMGDEMGRRWVDATNSNEKCLQATNGLDYIGAAAATAGAAKATTTANQKQMPKDL